MKKYYLIAIGLMLGLGFTVSGATSILQVFQGGTGWKNIQSGTILTGNGTGKLSTTTITTLLGTASTDSLPQGSTNKYWSNTLFDNRLSATTSLPNILTLAGLSITKSQVSDFGSPLYSAITGIKNTYGTTATGATQTLATSTADTNIGMTITSSGDTHTFTPYWIGTLADGRIASAGTWNAKESALTFSYPLLRSTNAISWQGLASSTNHVVGNLLYATGANTYGNVATGTVSSSGGITTTTGRSAVGGALAISCDVASDSIPGCMSAADHTAHTANVAKVGVSGGTAGMLTAWTSSTGLTATGTPTADHYHATSTTNASQFPYASSTSQTITGTLYSAIVRITSRIILFFSTTFSATEAGEVGINTGNGIDQLKWYGTRENVLLGSFEKSFNIASTTLGDADASPAFNSGTTTIGLWVPSVKTTVNYVGCKSDKGVVGYRFGTSTASVTWTAFTYANSTFASSTATGLTTILPGQEFTVQASSTSANKLKCTVNFGVTSN